LWTAATVGIVASEELDRAKELYRSASYDEALGVLDGLAVPASPETLEVNQFRVLCLVALDRRDEARKAMAALVAASPSFAMSEADAPPRVRTLFTEVRRELLPGIIQRAYVDAKAAFDRKDPAAATQFDRVLALLKDPDVVSNASLNDLGLVATGFRDLSKSFVPPPPPPVETPRVTAAPRAPVIVQPVAISQTIPVPQIRQERVWDGAIEVTINEQGKVTEARMTISIHPVYDQQLIRAAMNWTYRPALRDGLPTIAAKQVAIHIDTRPACSGRSTGDCRPIGN
jgi:TonB family protein